jgi:hypothetical protein
MPDQLGAARGGSKAAKKRAADMAVGGSSDLWTFWGQAVRSKSIVTVA